MCMPYSDTLFYMWEMEITSEAATEVLKDILRFLQSHQKHYGVIIIKNHGIKLFFQYTEHELIRIGKEFVVSLSNSHTKLKRSD